MEMDGDLHGGLEPAEETPDRVHRWRTWRPEGDGEGLDQERVSAALEEARCGPRHQVVELLLVGGSGLFAEDLGSDLLPDHDKRAPGSLSWAGINNTHFWIDPKRRVGAVWLAQVLPFYDEACIRSLRGFEEIVYQSLR